MSLGPSRFCRPHCLRSRFLLKVNQGSSSVLKLRGCGAYMALMVWFLKLGVGSLPLCCSNLESSHQWHRTLLFLSAPLLCLLTRIPVGSALWNLPRFSFILEETSQTSCGVEWSTECGATLRRAVSPACRRGACSAALTCDSAHDLPRHPTQQAWHSVVCLASVLKENETQGELSARLTSPYW